MDVPMKVTPGGEGGFIPERGISKEDPILCEIHCRTLAYLIAEMPEQKNMRAIYHCIHGRPSECFGSTFRNK
jgi:hypothetical protein